MEGVPWRHGRENHGTQPSFSLLLPPRFSRFTRRLSYLYILVPSAHIVFTPLRWEDILPLLYFDIRPYGSFTFEDSLTSLARSRCFPASSTSYFIAAVSLYPIRPRCGVGILDPARSALVTRPYARGRVTYSFSLISPETFFAHVSVKGELSNGSFSDNPQRRVV